MIRVLLSQMPNILRDILEHAVARQVDFELVRDAPDTTLRSISGHDTSPDVVIIASADGVPASMAMLARWPAARIMIVTPVEGEAALYELRPHITTLGHVSPA